MGNCFPRQLSWRSNMFPRTFQSIFWQQRLTVPYYRVLREVPMTELLSLKRTSRFSKLLISARPLRTPSPFPYLLRSQRRARRSMSATPTVRLKKNQFEQSVVFLPHPIPRLTHYPQCSWHSHFENSYAFWQIFLNVSCHFVRRHYLFCHHLQILSFFVTNVCSKLKWRRTTSFNNILHLPQFIIKAPLPNIVLSRHKSQSSPLPLTSISLLTFELPSLSSGEN
jgi:hypothetical protein